MPDIMVDLILSQGKYPDIFMFAVLDHLILPQGKYPESFMLISLLEVCQEWGVKKGGTWRTLGFLTIDREGMVIPDVMDDLILPQGRYPESFMLISLLKVCQE